jgi:hypothetical protein
MCCLACPRRQGRTHSPAGTSTPAPPHTMVDTQVSNPPCARIDLKPRRMRPDTPAIKTSRDAGKTYGSTCACVVWCAHVDVPVEARPLQRGVVERGVVGAVGGEGPTAGLDLAVPLRTPHPQQRKHHLLHRHIDMRRQENRIRKQGGQKGGIADGQGHP